jgi:hypothetical protein
MPNNILTNFITGVTDFNTTIKIIKDKLMEEIKKDIEREEKSNGK